ncbi:MAG: HAD family hydrolase [Syntrophomonadaceae bacterium]|jgi:FMN phosphatase YigB (HAD superfamily)|nr:HAD family hydrolase [Syntrophomonadaceae bacterium]
MFKAILFDLDGTLLDIDMNIFLQHYFRVMMRMAEEEGIRDSRRLVEQVYKSTDVMIADRDHNTSNEKAFMQDFFAATGWEETPVLNFFNKFYETGFPKLRKYCRPFPGIPEMMEDIFSKDIKVVIATNAVFPLTALEQRLAWAGLQGFDFELITSYEIMHYCKPHLEYYEEITRLINIKPQDCLMVGNDTGEDLPAGLLGMKTFLVDDLLIDKGASYKPTWRGNLKSFCQFAKSF